MKAAIILFVLAAFATAEEPKEGSESSYPANNAKTGPRSSYGQSHGYGGNSGYGNSGYGQHSHGYGINYASHGGYGSPYGNSYK